MKVYLKKILLFLFFPFFCFSWQLKEKFINADEGDFVVITQNENSSILFIRNKENPLITFEEISFPSHKIGKIQWQKWIDEGAPGATSWIFFTIDLQKGSLVKAYSYTHQTWIRGLQKESFLTQLLNLSLIPIEENERKRIGPPPVSDEVDRRPIWHPAICFEGKKIVKPLCEAWKTNWPQDESELSEKKIDLYFSKIHPRFPFPVWLQISDGMGSFKIRVLDAGKNLRGCCKNSFPSDKRSFR